MIDHTGISVADFDKAKSFYDGRLRRLRLPPDDGAGRAHRRR